MDYIYHYKIKKIKFLFLFIAMALFFLVTGCSTNTVLSSKITITPETQQELMGAVDRNSNQTLYESNLANPLRPNIGELLSESNLSPSEKFYENFKILVDWYSGKIPKHNLINFTNNCAKMVGNFTTYFPLTTASLPCAGFWLETKINARKFNAEQALKNKSQPREVKLNARDRLKWSNYKNLKLSDALRNLNVNEFTKVKKMAKTALTTAKNCSYTNANAALIFKLEEFLPKPEAYKYINEIYQASIKCYYPNLSITERLNTRIGMLHLMHGKYQLATNALKKNRFEKNPQDKIRNLFWLGAIEQYHKRDQQRNAYWEELIRENPFSFFSILANDKMERDPKSSFVSDHTIEIQNRIKGGWHENNLQTFLFDLFYTKKQTDALESLSRNVANNVSIIDQKLYLYWALNHSIAKNDRNSVFMLSKYFDSQEKRRVSQGLLKLNFPIRYTDEILNTSKKVDPLLVLALIRQESAFDAKARSSADARGLMQILPSTARKMRKNINVQKLFDPNTNIELGIIYLEKLFEKYQGRTEYVLAAYNAGPNRVDLWIDRTAKVKPLLFMEYLPYKETRNYVSTIMRNYYWYQNLMREQQEHYARIFLEKNETCVWKPMTLLAAINHPPLPAFMD